MLQYIKLINRKEGRKMNLIKKLSPIITISSFCASIAALSVSIVAIVLAVKKSR